MEYEVNARIRQLANQSRMTAGAFAKHIGVSVSATYVIFREDARPSYEMIKKIADAFPEVSMEWLVRGRGAVALAKEGNDPACWDLLKREEEQHEKLRTDYDSLKQLLKSFNTQTGNTLIDSVS